MIDRNESLSHQKKPKLRVEILLVFLLIFTLAGGAYLRLVGINWDEDQHMHPDERFLSLVLTSISPVESWTDYFDTSQSSLNPANRGYTFFVYGTLPLFIVRYLGEVLGRVDYHAITILGRQVSAISDVLTVLILYDVGKRLYNRWVGLLGAVFYSLAVLPIQLSHFATVDTMANTFAVLAIFGAVWALRRGETNPGQPTFENELTSEIDPVTQEDRRFSLNHWFNKVRHVIHELAPYLLFGAALGAATASKINVVVLAIVLPLVEYMRFLGLNDENRKRAILPALRNLFVAGVLSFLVFRLGQPYAFNGPSFFNFSINEDWWSGLQSLRVQASGVVDFPPALQWARRPISFAWVNLVAFGLGTPLGLFAWLAYLVMGYLILNKKSWRQHLPLWAFTGLYFTWQALSWVRTMRYQVLIYPLLCLVASWGLVSLLSQRRDIKARVLKVSSTFLRTVGLLLTVGIILATAAWAFAFSRIYPREHTRAASSRWIYQNIPGALTLQMDTAEGQFMQPLPYRAGDTFISGEPYRQPFIGVGDGLVMKVNFPHILDQSQTDTFQQVRLTITSAADPNMVLATSSIDGNFNVTENDWRGGTYDFFLDTPLRVVKGNLYIIELQISRVDHGLMLHGSPSITYLMDDGSSLVNPLPRIQQSIRPGHAYTMNVHLVSSGEITAVNLPYLGDQAAVPGLKLLMLELILPDQGGVSRSTTVKGAFTPVNDVRGESASFQLVDPLTVTAGETLTVNLSTETEGAQLVPQAPAPAHESSWDDAIPYPLDGFSPYSEGGGIYRGDLNFEMYWPDDQSKLERFETNLDLADYIFITSNRQWGTITRVPERYPLSAFYYRHLLGCPDSEDILRCYRLAEPGMYSGDLGFDLVETFTSYPNLGEVQFNTQFAEEAFTVYDHPKVLIFKKSADYDPLAARSLLGSVGLNKVVYFTPGEASKYKQPDLEQLSLPPHNLMLPEDRLASQRAGGTWSALFDRESLLNTSQPLAVIVFYAFALLLGWVNYPLVRLALPGLADKGYPLSKIASFVLLAFIVWIFGSAGISVTRGLITGALITIVGLNGFLFVLQRHVLLSELRENWRYFLMIEAIGLIAFLFFLLVRLGNPDLWHPFKGGEKPMDFSYLNAVIKSTTFPPYDPWFAGGFINYYYYGFVIVGIPIKLLGIVPSVAYNLVLPLWYSLFILGSFSIGWNLYQAIPPSKGLHTGDGKEKALFGMAFWAGLATAILMAVLGNLGTVQLLASGFYRLSGATLTLDQANLGQKIGSIITGFGKFLQGNPLPFYPGDWYWHPSRVIPGEPITEFPLFTFIYADLHAHLIAFPITLLVISWSLSILLNKTCFVGGKRRRKWLSLVISFLFGGLALGALRPTNTWDFYTYLVFTGIILFYSIFTSYQFKNKLQFRYGEVLEKLIAAGLGVLFFVLLTILLYQPFAYWYGQGYNKVGLWDGDRTPLGSYFTHWGLFLFIIISWLGWETYHWMKTTPASALDKLKPYLTWVYAILILTVIGMALFLVIGLPVGLVVLPIGLWTLMLILRPGQSDGGRFHLFMIGTALVLTLVVELVYLSGDIGRMNTVFKFYLQAWILFALGAGVSLSWLANTWRFWRRRLVFIWQATLYILVISAALFTVMGTADKISDRMTPEAPHTLDGMTYMAYSTFNEMGFNILLIEDYHAIHWMQEHIKGSPVIIEGQAYEYRWGNRYTIYTGLPGVVGWNWHQRQQRAILRNSAVQERVNAVDEFYTTENINFVQDFLDEYDVAYIVVGQLEQAFYTQEGLAKFDAYDGKLWDAVYHTGSTIIYQVRR